LRIFFKFSINTIPKQKIICELCGVTIEKIKLGLHAKDCQKRDKFCNFCNLYIKFDDYSNHIYSCSSRSKTCPYCQKYIILRDFEYHCESQHDDGIKEGEKIFDASHGLNYNLDFYRKNPFFQDKIRKSFKTEGLGVRSSFEEIRPNLIQGDEEENNVLEKENNKNMMDLNGSGVGINRKELEEESKEKEESKEAIINNEKNTKIEEENKFVEEMGNILKEQRKDESETKELEEVKIEKKIEFNKGNNVGVQK